MEGVVRSRRCPGKQAASHRSAVAVKDFLGLPSCVAGFPSKGTDDAGHRVGGGVMPSEALREKGEKLFLLCGRSLCDGVSDFGERAHGGMVAQPLDVPKYNLGKRLYARRRKGTGMNGAKTSGVLAGGSMLIVHPANSWARQT